MLDRCFEKFFGIRIRLHCVQELTECSLGSQPAFLHTSSALLVLLDDDDLFLAEQDDVFV